ncbi:putative restriction endonuclease [Agrobacterium pusense]|uniref:HNH endonuclease n=1 Tax=Agrobacterium pusense TaxID=648995 RepID=UPI00285DA1D7|nr:HNH endonuclease [Agrobacterium pusense]MDR6190352.1 putative restriction endonuclease [Agrobacterium pusense]
MKAVFDTKPTSVYDDDISRHYHFPRRYRSLVEQCVDDWVVLRRSRADGGNLAYFATARILCVEPDPAADGMSYARFIDFMEFDQPVAWRENGRYAEEALRSMPQVQVGVYLRGRSVRLISDNDFSDLIARGLEKTFDPDNADRFELPSAPLLEAAAAAEASNEPTGERAWKIQKALTNRVVRDANFRRLVCEAYGNRCAVTGLRISDGKGRTEAQAAHIWAVTDGGPDVVQNGLALSGTVHWLFDRHLISLTDDCRLLVAKDKIPAELQALCVQAGETIHVPTDSKRRPHPAYIAKHRAIFTARNRVASWACLKPGNTDNE